MSTEVSATVVKAFRVLRLFHDHPVITIAICEQELGLPRSTAHRALVSLREAGVVEQTKSGHYILSLDLFEIGVRSPRRRSLEDRIGGNLEALAYATGHRAQIAVQADLHVFYIECANGPIAQAQGMRTRVGYRGPLHASATGKILLAFGSEGLVDRVVAAGLERFTPYTVVDETALRRELDAVRAEDVVFARGQLSLNASAIAVPLRSWDGKVQAAISVVGDTVSIERDRDRILTELRGTAARIEQGVGSTYRRTIRGQQPYVSSA